MIILLRNLLIWNKTTCTISNNFELKKETNAFSCYCRNTFTKIFSPPITDRGRNAPLDVQFNFPMWSFNLYVYVIYFHSFTCLYSMLWSEPRHICWLYTCICRAFFSPFQFQIGTVKNLKLWIYSAFWVIYLTFLRL